MPSAQGFGTNTPRTKLTQSQLNVILHRHQAFRKSQPGGVRANLKLRDLSHLDLSNIDLSDADLSGAKLFSARLSGANLTNANLYAADLRLANLERADLRRADLRGACLRGAVLSEAVLVEVDLRDGTLLHYTPSGEMMQHDFADNVLTSELTAAIIRGADCPAPRWRTPSSCRRT